MIAIVEGAVVERALDQIVVMTAGGVGYALHVSTRTLGALPDDGQALRLQVHTHVREDAIQLFGFHDSAEREAFLLLTSVSGVGPRLALAVLSGLGLSELARAVAAGDVKRLTTVSGVGKKTAGRIALELKDKFGNIVPTAAELPLPVAGADETLDDLRSALTNLGFRPGDADRIVRRVEKELDPAAPTPPLEELVRLSLRFAK